MSFGMVGRISAQDFDIGLTGPQCKEIVDNAYSNPAKIDTVRLVRHCRGEFGPVISRLLLETALISSDLEAYKEIVLLASSYMEKDIFHTARYLAEGSGVPYLARIAGLSILNAYASSGGITPDLAFYQSYSGASTGCGGGGGSGEQVTYAGETDLPYDVYAQALQSAKEVIANANEAGLKFLASCIRARISSEGIGGGPDPASFTASTHFSHVKQCGRKFVLRNSSRGWGLVELAWGVGGGNYETREFTLPPRAPGSSYSETTWTIPGTDRYAKVSHNSSLIMNETPDDTPC